VPAFLRWTACSAQGVSFKMFSCAAMSTVAIGYLVLLRAALSTSAHASKAAWNTAVDSNEDVLAALLLASTRVHLRNLGLQVVRRTMASMEEGTKIKRPLNAYMRYTRDRREEVTADLKAKLGGNFKIGEVAKAIGSEWRALSEQQKKPYETAYHEDLQKYEEATASDPNTPAKKEEPKIKRPKNAFLLFADDHREEVTLTLQKAGKFTVGKASQQMGWEWQELGETKKKEYEKKAANLKKAYEAAISADPSLGPTKKKTRKKSEGPKKLSAYMHFCKERRPAVTSELKASMGPEFKQPEVLRALGAEWKTLDPNSKARFEELAKVPVE